MPAVSKILILSYLMISIICATSVPGLDLIILFRTIKTVLKGWGALIQDLSFFLLILQVLYLLLFLLSKLSFF